MRILKKRKGQFIVIAALMIAIMMVSIGAVMYGAVTYFKHERWEEYLAIIDNVKMGSHRVVEMSLANYTTTLNNNTLNNYLRQWQSDLKKAYAGYGVILVYSLLQVPVQAYGLTINYQLGLAYSWSQQTSFSAANVTMSLNITSVGLTGYEFAAYSFLKMKILDALWYSGPKQVGVRLVVDKEGPTPITNLQKTNFIQFEVDGTNKTFTLYRYYDSKTHNSFVYELRYDSATKPPTVTVTNTVMDFRSVKVTSRATLTVTDA